MHPTAHMSIAHEYFVAPEFVGVNKERGKAAKKKLFVVDHKHKMRAGQDASIPTARDLQIDVPYSEFRPNRNTDNPHVRRARV